MLACLNKCVLLFVSVCLSVFQCLLVYLLVCVDFVCSLFDCVNLCCF